MRTPEGTRSSCEWSVDERIIIHATRSAGQEACAARLLDLLFGEAREKFCLDDDWYVRQDALAQHLVVPRLVHVDHRCLVSQFTALRILERLFADKCPNFVQVDDRAMVQVLLQVVFPHADFAKVTRVVLVHEYPVVVLAAGVTAATRVLPVLADTAMARRNVAALFPVLMGTRRHPTKEERREQGARHVRNTRRGVVNKPKISGRCARPAAAAADTFSSRRSDG